MAVPAQVIAFTLGQGSNLITFSRFEVPDKFDFGHEIKQAVHDYLSETGTPIRQVTSQGAFPLPNSWKGILIGSGAIDRAMQLDAMAVAGQPVTFTYGPLSWQVAIKNFKASPNHQFDIDYEFELTTIADLNGVGRPIDQGISFDVGTQSFWDQANSSVSDLQTADPQLPASLLSALDDTATQAANCYPFKQATLDELNLLLDSLTETTDQLNLYNNPLLANAVLEADLAKLDASLSALQSYSLFQMNIELLVGTGTGNQVLSGFVGSLFDVAAQYYPNSDAPTVAQLICQANSLDELFVDTPTNIALPPVFA